MMKLLRVLLALLLVGLGGCRNQADLAGTYEAPHPAEAGHPVVLSLLPDGNGSWTVDDEELAFRWDRKGPDVLLHTRSGGIIAGRVTDGPAIAVAIPGVGPLTFTRRSP